MLERLDELYDRDDDGQFVKFKEVERIRELAKLCPTRLRNHRVVSLELANLVAGTKYRGMVAVWSWQSLTGNKVFFFKFPTKHSYPICNL